MVDNTATLWQGAATQEDRTMTDWEDLDREIGSHDTETGAFVVRRRQRRLKSDGSYEFRWVKVGVPA